MIRKYSIYICFSIFVFFILNLLSFSQQTLPVIPQQVKTLLNYMSPLPGSDFNNCNTTIALRFNENINTSSVYLNGAVKITGSKGGEYLFSIKASTDGRSLILKPFTTFKYGEEIKIEFSSAIKDNGRSISPVSYSFKTSLAAPKQESKELVKSGYRQSDRSAGNSADNSVDIPQITINVNNNPAPGYFFLSNIVFNNTISNSPYLLVVDNSGYSVFNKSLPNAAFDFNKQYNGNFTYFDEVKGKYYEVDMNFNIVDSFYTGNGYLTDLHELRVLRNRHALLMSYDTQTVDMSKHIAGGDTAALVTGLIIQEIDAEKSVVFQWRSWDHYRFTDATHEDLTAHKIDYVHGNAIEVDYDGNIMISSRHLDEITKINIQTGDIIWRLGGKNNDFTFINDNRRFSYQHAIRRIANGNITLYDNGNYHTPQYSRAIEYKLDEVNKTAELIWEYRNSPDIYGFAMGNVQRLENGNTLISWGATNPTLTEVKQDGTKAFEMTLPQNIFTYRAFKYKLGPEPIGVTQISTVIPEKFTLSQNYPNPFNPSTKIRFTIKKAEFVTLKIYNILGSEVKSLVNEDLLAGEYEIPFDASEFSSGIYYYKMNAGNYSETKKMVLIK